MKEQEYSTNDWNGYVMVDTCRQDDLVSTVTPSSDNRQSSDMLLVLSSLNAEQKLLQKIAHLKRERISCDVYLSTDDGTIFSAHKIILSIVSDYFAAMFQSNMAEKSQAIIKIQGVESFALKCLINFAYSAKITVTSSNIFEILITANMLRFEEVERICIDFLCRNLDLNNCGDILTISELINNRALHDASMSFVTNQFSQISRHSNFVYFPVEQVEMLLANDNIDVTSETDVFDAVVSWVKFDSISRVAFLPRLLKHVRLTLMSRKYLVDIVLRESLIMNEETSRNIVLEALDQYILPERSCLPKSEMPHSPRQATYRTLYVLGGQVQNNSKCSCESYNFKTKAWSSLPSMKYPRHSASAVILDGNLYVLGGICKTKYLSSVEKYNSVTNSWKIVAHLRRCRGALAAIAIDGWIYAVGGSNGRKEALKYMERYDPISDSWTDLPDMKFPRSSFGVAHLRGRLYAVGGYCGISEINNCECFDPLSKSWSNVSKMNKSRMNHAVVTCQDRLYAIGGKNSVGLINSIEKYNPDIDMWLVIKTNFEMRNGICSIAGATPVNNIHQSVFVVGGMGTNDNVTKEVSTVSLKSPDFQNGSFLPMLEERAFPAAAIL